jgi:cytochrome c553
MKKLKMLAICAVLAVTASEATAGDAAAGEARYAQNCINCHGSTGKGMASFPALIGRDADYITGRLTSYRARERVGPNSAIMMSWASKLSDEEIANLAAYISTTFQQPKGW